MHIFIDETGSFTGIGKSPSISLVAALIVPDSRLASLEKKFERLRKSLPKNDKGEVKGRLLDEKEIASVVPLLLEHSALFEVACTDLGLHTEEGVRAFQARFARRMTDALTDQHQDAFKAQVWELRGQFEAFSLPLMIQSMLTFELFPRPIEHGMMYYSTRRPEELGSFNWVDAKGTMETPTEWEAWWSRIVMPYVQTRAERTPFNYLRVGDYTHLARFQVEPDGFTPRMASRWKEGDPLPLDLKAILMESFNFLSSSNQGLELVDILTNATRRAIIGNLKRPGWVRIPELMVHRKGRSYISVHVLQQMPTPQVLPYSHVLNAYGRTGRVMIPAHLRNKKF